MFPLSIPEFVLTMAVCMFVTGILSLCAGVIILFTKVVGKDLQVLAQQTTELAEKGIADDVAGLVGNATSLVSALNELVRTASGIGIFLVMVGFVQILAAYLMITRMY